jgi:SSS family solute:Na+ symporter
MKELNIYDYLVVGAYFVFMMGIGLYFMRINKGGKEYFAGGNMIPWWVSGVSLYMSNFSAWTFTGAAGFAYATGWFATIYFAIWSLAYYAGSQLTAARWRRSRTISPVEYTHTRFNKSTQQLLGSIICLNFTLSAGVQLSATSKLLAPMLQIDIITLTLGVGLIILLYTFLGGLWAVTVTDTVQGIILLALTFIILPLSLDLVGGFGNLVDKLPPLTFDHTVAGQHYTVHWLVSIFIIMALGTASGGAQRFFAVKDEKEAKRVGKLAGALFVTVPLVFGIPPLVARVLWPDLSQVDFFKPYAINPQDLVYVGMAMKLLPNGLIGIFIAAMLAATMSALSTVYNLVSSIISTDMYKGVFRPETTDEQLLVVGRVNSAIIGVIVTGLAVVFVTSQYGLFNLMQTFFTLFNIPGVVPVAFGLLIAAPPRWAAMGTIIWGLIVGVITRFGLGWDIGPQVYLAFALSLSIFLLSPRLAQMYKNNKGGLAVWSILCAVFLALLFYITADVTVVAPARWIGIIGGLMVGGSLYAFAAMFARDTEEDRRVVDDFFKRLNTPVDVGKEVFAKGKKVVSTFPLVGATSIIMALLLALIFFTPIPEGEGEILGTMIAMMMVIGGMMWYFGKKSEIRTGEQMRKAQLEREAEEAG